MTTVEIDIEKIKTAITACEELAGDIDAQRHVAKSASPVHLPTLGDDTLGKKAEWLETHLDDLTMRRDLAILLDTEGTGSATYEIPYDSAYNVKQMLSEELAEQLGNLDHDSDADDYERLSTIMAAWQDDPEMMSELFEELGPDGTVAALSNISNAIGYGADPDIATGLAEQLRTGLSSASNDPSFDSEQFAQDIVRYSVAPLLTDEEWEEFQERHGGISMTGGNILTFLMEDTTYSDEFLLSAAAQLEEFEKMADEPMDASFWYSHNGHGPLPTGDGEYNGWHDDPMAAIMHNLGENPEAGLTFFTEDTGDFNRQMYYFNDRNWEADGYAGISHAAEGIGTSKTNLEDDPEATTALVSNFFDLVANSEGFNPEDATAASPYVSDLMKFYMPAVDNALRHPNEDGTGGSDTLLVHGIGEFEHYPVMFTADLDSLMGVAMSTQEGTQNIAEGIGQYQQTQLNNLSAALAADPDNGALLTQLKGALQHSAALQGFAEYTVGTVEIEGAADRDAQRQAFIDLVSDASSLVPLPGASVVGKFGSSLIDFGFDQAVNLGTDAAGETFASEEAAATDKAEDRAAAGSTRVKISAFLSLVESGVIPEDSIPSIWQDENGDLVSPADIPADRISLYSQAAMDSVMNHAESTDFDLEGPYEAEFQEYYQPASGD